MLGQKPAWGIEAGCHSLKAVKLAKSGDAIEVQALEVIPYKTDTYDPDEMDKDELFREALRELAQRHKLSGCTVVASIPGNKVFPKFIKLPPVEKKRIPEIVRYESRQQIPFPIDDVIWSYQPVEETPEPGEEIEVGIFAVKREDVYSFLANFKAVGLQPDIIQASWLALYNFIEFEKPDHGTAVIIDIGAENTDFIIADGNRYWPRNINTKGNDITSALQKKFQIPFTEAEKLKRNAAKSKQAKKLFGVVQPVLRRLLGDIQRSIGFYKSQHESVKFEKVIFLGDAFKFVGLADFFKDNLQYVMEPLGKPTNFTLSNNVQAKQFQDEYQALCFPLGLALQGIENSRVHINLMPPEYLMRKAIAKKKPFVAAAAAMIFMTTVFSFLSHSAEVNKLEAAGEDAGKINKSTTFLGELQDKKRKYEGVKDTWMPVSQEITNLTGLVVDRDSGLNKDVSLLSLHVISSIRHDKVWLEKVRTELVTEEVDGVKRSVWRTRLQGKIEKVGTENDNVRYFQETVITPLRNHPLVAKVYEAVDESDISETMYEDSIAAPEGLELAYFYINFDLKPIE